MRSLITTIAALTMVLTLAGTAPAFADGCYICSGGSYVKYTGGDTQDKRNKAKDCGCQISGTRSSCDAANLKVLCTVVKDSTAADKLAVVMQRK